MCGIIAIHSRPSTRPVPTAEEILSGLDHALAAGGDIGRVADETAAVDRLLRGISGLRAMVGRHDLIAGITARLDQLDAVIATREAVLESDTSLTADEVEQANATLVRLRLSLIHI